MAVSIRPNGASVVVLGAMQRTVPFRAFVLDPQVEADAGPGPEEAAATRSGVRVAAASITTSWHAKAALRGQSGHFPDSIG
jgi:hypothetical protein